MTEVPAPGDLRIIFEPTIKKVRGATFIGIGHVPAVMFAGMPVLPRVIDILGNSDHLLLEGVRGIHQANARLGLEAQGFEDLGISIFFQRGKGANIHYLEENKDPIGLAVSHGIDLNTAILLHNFNTILGINSSNLVDPASRSDHVRQDVVDRTINNFPALTIEREEFSQRAQEVVDNVATFQANHPRASQEYKMFEGGYMYLLYYMRNVRDFEIIGPELIRLLPDLSGEPVVLLGKDHIASLEQVVTGKGFPSLPAWPVLREEFDPQVTEYSQFFAAVANGWR